MEEFNMEDLLEEANADIRTSTTTDTLETPEIPLDNTLRFSGAPWYKEIQNCLCIIGGCGGIGSHLAFQLARMRPAYIKIYDPDIVDATNLAGQLFSMSDIGKKKNHAIWNFCSQYANYKNIDVYDRKILNSTLLSSSENLTFYFSCFDNMEARKTMYEHWQHHHTKGESVILIDGRLSLDTLQVLYVDGTNYERYEKEYLFSDEEADATACSMKQTTFMASMIASFMVNIVTTYLTNKTIEDEALKINIPLLTEYDSSLMYLKTID